MTANKLMKKANTQDKRLKKIVVDAINEIYGKHEKKMKNPFYRLYAYIRAYFFKKKYGQTDFKNLIKS